MSLEVVMNGPVAIAGSILFLLRKIGTMVPIIAAMMMTESRATEIVMEIIIS